MWALNQTIVVKRSSAREQSFNLSYTTMSVSQGRELWLVGFRCGLRSSDIQRELIPPVTQTYFGSIGHSFYLYSDTTFFLTGYRITGYLTNNPELLKVMLTTSSTAGPPR